MTKQKVRVVIADSAKEILSKQLLAQEGEMINVVYATDDGNEVYEKVLELKPDVLLIDVFITNIDGLEVVEQIKSNQDLKDTRIIFLSTVGSPRIINMAFNLGADYYIMKPCSPDILCKRVIQMASILKQKSFVIE